MSEELIHRLADDLGGHVDEIQQLPDGSGFAVVSMPLPPDHWIYGTGDDCEPPPMPFRIGTADTRRSDLADKIRAAGRYAVRAATLQGKDMDFDPDALIQNLVVGMLGYWTSDGLSTDAWANPPHPPTPLRLDPSIA